MILSQSTMTESKTWTHLIRFEHNGTIYCGNAVFSEGQLPDQVSELAASGKLHADVIVDDCLSPDAVVSDQRLLVHKLLCPLTEEQVPIIRCVGLNYMQHSENCWINDHTYEC